MNKCVIVNDTSYDFHHGCEVVMSNIIYLLNNLGIQVMDTNYVGIYWKKNKNFLKQMEDVDIVIVNGEGTIHHATQRAKELSEVAIYVKKYLKKPIVLINTTYQDNGDDISENMKYFDLIFVRESLSQLELKKYGIKSIVVPDMTFYSKYNISKKRQSKSIGVTDSVYDHVSKKLYKLSIKNNYKYLPALTTPTIKTLKLKVVRKVWKFYIRKSIRWIQWKLFQRFDIISAGIKYYVETDEKYIQTIANQKFIYIGRFHSLCFALKTLTPFVAIQSNSHKIEGMLKDIGIESYHIVDYEKIETIKYRPFKNNEEEKIQQYVKEAPIRIEAMFQQINNLINSKKDKIDVK